MSVSRRGWRSRPKAGWPKRGPIRGTLAPLASPNRPAPEARVPRLRSSPSLLSRVSDKLLHPSGASRTAHRRQDTPEEAALSVDPLGGPAARPDLVRLRHVHGRGLDAALTGQPPGVQQRAQLGAARRSRPTAGSAQPPEPDPADPRP